MLYPPRPSKLNRSKKCDDGKLILCAVGTESRRLVRGGPRAGIISSPSGRPNRAFRTGRTGPPPLSWGSHSPRGRWVTSGRERRQPRVVPRKQLLLSSFERISRDGGFFYIRMNDSRRLSYGNDNDAENPGGPRRARFGAGGPARQREGRHGAWQRHHHPGCRQRIQQGGLYLGFRHQKGRDCPRPFYPQQGHQGGRAGQNLSPVRPRIRRRAFL